jgi:outer membrane protein
VMEKLPAVILFFLYSFCINAYALQDTIVLSLEDALKLAQERNPDVLVADYEARISGLRLKEAQYSYIPRIEGVGQYNRNLQRPVIFLPEGSPFGSVLQVGFDNAYTATISASMPLISPALISNIRIARTGEKLSQEVLRGIRQQIRAEVKRAYFNAQLASEALKVMEQSIENSMRNTELVRQMFNQGVVAEFDLIRSEVQLESLKPSLDQAKNNLIISHNALKILLGLPAQSFITIPDSLAINVDEKQVLPGRLSVDNNSALKQIEHRLQLAKEQVNLVRAARYPALNALGNFQTQAQANDFNFGQYNWVNSSIVGLQLRVPIFNGLVIQQQARQAELASLQAQEQKKALERNLLAQLENQLFMMQNAYQRIAAQQKALELSAKALEIARVRYESGSGNIIELNDAELAHTQANLNLLQAIHEYHVASAEYEQLIGGNQ